MNYIALSGRNNNKYNHMTTFLIILTIWIILGVLTCFRLWYLDEFWDKDETVYLNIIFMIAIILLGGYGLHYALLEKKKKK